MLTEISQINPKLTFNVFHILNHGRISKIEKIFDGPDPPPKKNDLFWGGSGSLYVVNSGYVSGCRVIHKIKIVMDKKLDTVCDTNEIF